MSQEDIFFLTQLWILWDNAQIWVQDYIECNIIWKYIQYILRYLYEDIFRLARISQ